MLNLLFKYASFIFLISLGFTCSKAKIGLKEYFVTKAIFSKSDEKIIWDSVQSENMINFYHRLMYPLKEEDLSSSFKIVYDDLYMYIKINVNDDSKSNIDTKLSFKFPENLKGYNDCIELYFDTNNANNNSDLTSKQIARFVYIFDYISYEVKGVFNSKDDMHFFWDDYENGYSLEVHIPLSSLEVFPEKEETEIRFEVKVKDSDNYMGDGILMKTKAVLSWSEVSTKNAHKDSSVYGILKFDR